MPLTIYSSSAGSGKTYTLTREYLKLLLPRKGGRYFRHVLAVTFTNKATAEMKERVVKALHEISTGNGGGLLESLSAELSMEADVLKERASEALNGVLHGYSDFYISTIDSFFQRILRSFSRETGLQAGFKVELDEDKVLDEVADQLLIQVGADKVLTGWLIQFVNDRIEEGKGWDIRSSIKSLARELFRESFKAIEDEIFTPDFSERIQEFRNEIGTLKAGIEREMNGYGREALTIIDTFGLEVGDFSYKTGGPAGYFLRIAGGASIDDFEPGARPLKAASDNTGWYSKESPRKEQIQEAVDNGLHEIMCRAVVCWQKNGEMYASATEVLRNLYTFGILHYIAEEIRRYRDGNDVLLISDTAQLLDKIIAGNDTPFIYEKTGNRFNHFLIDEFQDTSAFQWNNLRPLLLNSLSSDHYSMIVGDVKQSIYRFRGGDWRLLLEKAMDDFKGFRPQRASLSDNWRSKAEVIRFNNIFFKHAAECLQQNFRTMIGAITDDSARELFVKRSLFLSRAYEDVMQNVPATGKTEGGYVNISLFKEEEERPDAEPKDTKGWKEKVNEHLPSLVEQLQDKGYSPRDITFLVRTRQEGADIAKVLNDYKNAAGQGSRYKYDVVSSESLEMGASESLNFIISVIRHLYQPSDDIVKTQLLYLYFRLRHKEAAAGDFLHDIFHDASPGFLYRKYLPVGFVERRAYLSKLPLFELIEQLVVLFELNTDKEEFVFLQFFLDAVLSFARDNKADIPSFLEWWEERGKHQSVIISEEQDAMKIVTLHKSKGLQYKVVVMPYCNWDIETDPRKNTILWCRNEKPPFTKFSYLPMRFSSSLKGTFYFKEYYEEILMSYMDNLNLLYVAFTRSVDRLHILGPMPRQHKDGSWPLKKISDLLVHTHESSASEGNGVVSETESMWMLERGSDTGVSSRTQVPSAGAVVFTDFPVNKWSSRLSISSRAEDMFRSTAALRISYGILLHRILSAINRPSDVELVLENIFYEGLVSEGEKHELKVKLEALFLNSTVQHWFSGDWDVRNEKEILLPGNKTCRPDKVLIKDKRAVVIDFKTGSESEDHKEQVLSYTKHLEQMNYSEVQGYLLYLGDYTIKRVK